MKSQAYVGLKRAFDFEFLMRALDRISAHGGEFHFLDFNIDERDNKLTEAKMLIKADSPTSLASILTALRELEATVYNLEWTAIEMPSYFSL